MRLFALLFPCLRTLTGVQSPEKWIIKSAEQRLLYDLLLNYEPSTRPVKEAKSNVTVRLGMALINIFDLIEMNNFGLAYFFWGDCSEFQNEKTQTMTTNLWIIQQWDDEMLKWDPEHYGIQHLRIPDDRIWLPDTVLYNSASGESKGFMRINAMVNHNGTVFWSPPAKQVSTCRIDITYFPFDYQRCYFKFGSWAYHGYEVDVIAYADKIDLTNYVENGEFELLWTAQKQHIIQYSCCPEPYPHMLFVLHLRRKTLYYMYTVIVPCVIMSGLSLVVFFLPPDSSEKISLGISVFLTFSVYVLMIAEKVPETSDAAPLISVYLSVAMTTTGISTLMTVLVLNIHHMQHQSVPPWISKYILIKLRHFLCISAQSEAIRKCSAYKKMSSTAPGFSALMGLLPLPVKLEVSGSKVKEKSSVKLLRQLREKVTRRHFELENAEAYSNQWKLVAVIIDRLLFFVFFGTSVLVTLIFVAAISYIEMNRAKNDFNSSFEGIAV